MGSFLQSIVDPKNWLAALHMKTISRRLRNYDNDDLYDPYYDVDVKEALNRLPREVVDARTQRLKRAMDLSTNMSTFLRIFSTRQYSSKLNLNVSGSFLGIPLIMHSSIGPLIALYGVFGLM
ncbi:hypothetical protein SAY86_026927 [Trapa natans]|uniref:Cytochrome b-c1 complex subunit 7 n=1 Tax=Trapa natans TaxID=22666 RepID=A0AAN7KLN2_TRANT|nr:hypothetical protein SAY86_026927 [Trapa natans]